MSDRQGSSHSLPEPVNADRHDRLVDAGLTEMQATAWLLYQKGYKHREIADFLDIETGTASSHVNRTAAKRVKANKLLAAMHEVL